MKVKAGLKYCGFLDEQETSLAVLYIKV